MSFSTKDIVIGLMLGLVIGSLLGYTIAPKGVDTSELDKQINQLANQVDDLQSQVDSKNTQISNLQSQITNLQSQIDELEALVPPVRRGEWNLIETFEGSSGWKTDYFYVTGTDLRINWTWTSTIEEFSSFSVYLYKEGQSLWTEMFYNLQKEGTTFAHNIKAANYYLDISEANLDSWRVTVEVFILAS